MERQASSKLDNDIMVIVMLDPLFNQMCEYIEVRWVSLSIYIYGQCSCETASAKASSTKFYIN